MTKNSKYIKFNVLQKNIDNQMKSEKQCMNKMRISPKRQNKKESDSGAEEYNN